MKLEEKIEKELKDCLGSTYEETTVTWRTGFRAGFRRGYALAYEEANERLRKLNKEE